MKTYTENLEELLDKAVAKLVKLIDTKGIESKHYSDNCLKIKDDDCMFNLDGGRYLTEIKKVDRYSDNIELVDNSGYTYNYSVLETADFLQVVDHLIEVNRKKR